MVRVEGLLDLAGHPVDRCRELGDRLERTVLAPPGDIRNRLPTKVQVNARTHDETDGVNDHLSLRPGILPVVDAHRMRDLVDQNPHPRVRRLTGVDDAPLPLRVAPPAYRPVDRLERHGEPERASEPLKRLQQMLMRVAAQRARPAAPAASRARLP